jgi:hypothetical protein
VQGGAYYAGQVALEGSLSLTSNFVLQGMSTSLLLSNPDSTVSLGGSLRVVGPSTLSGPTSLGSSLVTAGPGLLRSTLEVGGATSLSGQLTVAQDSTLMGGLSVGGTASFLGDMTAGGNLIFGSSNGALSVSSGPDGGVVGAPLLLRGASQFIDGTDAPGVSILGGDAQNGFGGNVVLSGGKKGGDDHWAGSVLLQDSMGQQRLSANEAGVAMDGGVWGVISTSPALVASGALSVLGSSALLGPAFVQNDLLAANNAVVQGTVSVHGDLIQTGLGGHLSYTGTLSGSGWLDPKLITVCAGPDWMLGGICYGLFSQSPSQAGAHAVLYWNMDTVTHSIIVDGAPTWINISPGAMFPVYVMNARRRVLSAEELAGYHRRLTRVSSKGGEF